jgi:hypothetical protein
VLSGAGARAYFDKDCPKGSKGITLRLVRTVENQDNGRTARNGIFEIKNKGSKVFYFGYSGRGGPHVDYPEATLQMDIIDGVGRRHLFGSWAPFLANRNWSCATA